MAACDHGMIAQARSCTCPQCGATCTGRFAGCAEVWARGPREGALHKREMYRADPLPASWRHRELDEAVSKSLSGRHRPTTDGPPLKPEVLNILARTPESVVVKAVRSYLVAMAEDLDGALANASPTPKGLAKGDPDLPIG